ncbi:MAG: OB-fold domain-containing protein [Sulfuricellaceae bacterium]
MNQPLLPVVPDLCAVGEQGELELSGSFCAACRRYAYPRVEHCPGCLQLTERKPVGGRGRIYSYTVIRTRPPFQLPEPYAVGYIDLAASGLRVFGLFHPEAIEQLRIGMPVALEEIPLGINNDGQLCLRPVFSPAGTSDEH